MPAIHLEFCVLDDHVPSTHTNFKRALKPNCFLILIAKSHSSAIIPTGLAAAWWCSRGRIIASTPGTYASIDRRSIYISDSHREHTIVVGGQAAAFAIVATQSSWSNVLRSEGGRQSSSMLFPAIHSANSKNVLRIIRLTRRLFEHWNEASRIVLACEFGSQAAQLQAHLAPCIERCPGRSQLQRENAFMRLKRARNSILFGKDASLDVPALAVLANYSLASFIKNFARAFQDTPHSFVLKCRVRRAQELLRETRFGTAEIADATGFDSSRALRRALTRETGLSATQLRQGVRSNIPSSAVLDAA
jgi:AraC-like DNA-binding protein